MTDLIDYMPRTDQFWEGNELPESLRCRPGRIDFDVLFFLWKDFMISVIGSLRSFSFFIISSAKTHWCGFLSATQACSTSSSILLLRWQNNESYNWARGQILLPSDRCKFWGPKLTQQMAVARIKIRRPILRTFPIWQARHFDHNFISFEHYISQFWFWVMFMSI